MRRAARYGRGSFVQIGKLDEVDQQMSALLSKIASPLAADVNVQWQGAGDVRLSPANIPDLYLGEPLILTAKLAKPDATLTLAADTASGVWQQHFDMKAASPARGIDKLWARYQIEDRLDRRSQLGEQQRRSEVLALALKYQLLSPYTSFIAVDKTPARSQQDALAASRVGNTPPAGQTPQRYAMPATAHGIAQRWLWSGILVLVALLLVAAIKQEQRHGL
jgi:Ca-activated chloride channel family protein